MVGLYVEYPFKWQYELGEGMRMYAQFFIVDSAFTCYFIQSTHSLYMPMQIVLAGSFIEI